MQRLAVIPKGTTHSFWQSIHAGARKAEEELIANGQPVEVIWKGPLQEDDRAAQIDVVETFIARGVDGMVLAPLDATALVPPVRTARQNGIPVVVIDSGIETDVTSFVATDNFAAGRLAGEHLASRLGGTGKIILLRYMVGSASTEAREAGFLEAMGEHPGIELLSTSQHGGATRDTAYTAAQNLLNRFGGEVDGVFTPNESTTNSMLLALRGIGRAGEVHFVGFDGGQQNLEALRAGDLHGLVLQDPFRMGYLGVMTMAAHLRGEDVEPMIDTGAKLLTPENIDEPAMQDLVNPPLDEYLDR